jgi:CheY-like chemotaxis protein/anti-sigma regulatory factor (Ser/Thr protein kinase)
LTISSQSMPSLERIMAVNHHLRLALDQVSDAVVVVENEPLTAPGPKVLYANEAMAKATGVPVAGLCDVPLQALCEGNSLLDLLYGLAGAPSGFLETTAPLNHIKDKPSRRRWSAVPVKDGSGKVLNYILTASPDQTPAKSATTPVPSAAAAPRETPPPTPDEYQHDVVETIRDTARYVAHEFNNSLTAILLPVQIAIRQVPDGGDLHGKLQVAYESARRAADLAKDFLDCFRPRHPVRERLRLDGLLGRAMRLATCAQNVNWSLEVADDLHEAYVDLNQIERVIFNLVRNACQAMPHGGKLLVKATNTTVSASEGHSLKPGDYIHISVRDWGPGIPEEHMPHLFHSCFTTKDNGNGCGLPICYQIVRDHGGDMYVKSRQNVGTAFLIFLPAAEKPASTPAPEPAQTIPPAPATAPVPPASAAAPVPATAPVSVTFVQGPVLPPLVVRVATAPVPAAVTPPLPDPPPEPAPFVPPPPPQIEESTPSMLVVDDEDGVRRALEQIGKVYGFDVVTTATSEEGIQSYRDRLRARRRYDTVLLDLNLRGSLNGIEVFDALRRIDPEVLVIATSGQYAEGDLAKFQEIGFAGFLPKPFTLEDFDEVLQEVLAPQ